LVGKIANISQNKKKFAVKQDDESYSIIELMDESAISIGDLVLAQFVTGDVLVKNETKKTVFEAYIHHLGVAEKNMLKLLNQ